MVNVDKIKRHEMDIEQLAIAAGMTSALNMGSGSCVSSDGCTGVTQEHLEKFAALVQAAERARCAQSCRAMMPMEGTIRKTLLDLEREILGA